MTRFLNKVRFHYVPAIKDRRIFEDLLGSIYAVVASHEEFLASLRTFSTELRTRTSDLSDGLLTSLAFNSVIAPPTDLTELFRSLDFETTSEHGDSYSLTLQRGDGVQVRHIPAILAFLSDRSGEDYHLWGFEEPENSLELANAIAEAEAFCRYGKDDNKQIFLTSHSPAFFALDSAHVRRFFVSKTAEVEGRTVSEVRFLPQGDGKQPGELMGETPHLPVISHYLREADVRIRAAAVEREGLARELEENRRSIVFVEGESNARIISAAWAAFAQIGMPFTIRPAAGTTRCIVWPRTVRC